MYRVEKRGYKRFLTTTAKRFKEDAATMGKVAIRTAPPLTDRLDVTLIVRPPKAGKRDLDNIAKLVLDAMNGILWMDDSQIDRLEIIRGSIKKGGAVYVTVAPISEPMHEPEPESPPTG